MPMNSKIDCISQSPINTKHSKANRAHQISGKTENGSFDLSTGNAQLVRKLTGKVDTGTTMPEVRITPDG